MAFNLRNRHLLKLLDFTPQEITFLLQLAADLKAAKYAGIETQRLKGKNIALIFEKDSTRTRSAFEVAAFDQGAHVTFIGPTGSHIGYKESMKDTARVLGRMYDGIEYRGFSQENVDILARMPESPCGMASRMSFIQHRFLPIFSPCRSIATNRCLRWPIASWEILATTWATL